MKINVKWQKETFKDVDVDTAESPYVLKTQLYSLTGVPPDRQKVMCKGGMLGDAEWGKVVLKDKQTVMLMGSADKLPDTPQAAPQFLEDLPEEEQANADTRQYGAGLANLGNTCYMNSCLQCLYAVPELKQALVSYRPPAAAQPSVPTTHSTLAVQSANLFKQMERGGTAVPSQFLQGLRAAFPQFDQLGNPGPEGVRGHAQQDAEECWTQVMYAWRNALDAGDSAPMKALFGLTLRTELKCAESEETLTETTDAFSLKCNIKVDINHLNDGLKLALVEDREKNSEALGRSALWSGTAKVATLPQYLTVQLMRFFYKVDTQNKAKILRKVTYPLQLDLFDLCTPELVTQLKGPRWAFKICEDERVGIKTDAAGPSKSAAAAEEGADDMEAGDSAVDHTGAMTGRYDLMAVLTHKGRSADSGHYVGWVKQADGLWIEFDDDNMIAKNDEDIVALNGGGDWHSAYMLLYRAQRVPAKEAPAADATSAEAAPMET